MKVSVISKDGVSRIYNEDGEDISKFVHKIKWKHKSGKPPTAEVTFVAVALDWIGDARVNVEAVKDDAGSLEKQ